MRYMLESSTKNQYDSFRDTLGKTEKSKCFNDFVSTMNNDNV